MRISFISKLLHKNILSRAQKNAIIKNKVIRLRFYYENYQIYKDKILGLHNDDILLKIKIPKNKTKQLHSIQNLNLPINKKP